MITKKIFLTIPIIILILFILKSYIPQLSFQQPYSPSQDILVIFQEYVLKYDIDKKSIDQNNNEEQSSELPSGFDELQKKIDYFVQHNQSILLTMVGFPYKSSNTRDKALTSSADGAERYSLQYLQTFLNKIKKYYSPGARLRIFTDGIVFCDIEKVSDEAVMEYENKLKILSEDLPDIEIVTMRDLCENKSPHTIRTLISAMDPSPQNFNSMLNSDKKLQDDIDTLTKRMAFELALSSLSYNEIADIGLKETHRSMQYSNFLKKFRPEESISCSVHYQKNVARKIGLKLSESCITPWHGVLVESHGNITIAYLKDINQSCYKKEKRTVNELSIAYLKKIIPNTP